MKDSKDRVEREQGEQENKERSNWRRWLNIQSDGGGAAGAAHAFVRRVQQEPDLVVSCMGRKSVAVQDVVQAGLVEWKQVWNALPHMASAPWRSIQWKDEERDGLAPIT